MRDKAAEKARLKAHYEANKEKAKQRSKEWRLKNPERKRELNREYKKRNPHKIREYALKNAAIIKEKHRIKYEENKEERLQKSKEYYQNNKEAHAKSSKAYHEKNRQSIRSKQREYKKNRLRTDPAFRLVELARRRVSHALKGVAAKSARTLELIGCDGDFLRQHLEAQFVDGMTWENQGEWHIDHHIPVAFYDLTDPAQQKKCFHYSNLRPLWAKENRKKWSTIPLKALIDPV